MMLHPLNENNCNQKHELSDLKIPEEFQLPWLPLQKRAALLSWLPFAVKNNVRQ